MLLENEIYTLDLILDLTHEDLRNDFKIPLGAAKLIEKKISEMNGTNTGNTLGFGNQQTGSNALEPSAMP